MATPLGTALAGLERREQQVDGSTAYDVSQRTIDAVFAGLNGQSGAHSWQANLRRDRNSQFGGSTTGFAGYAYRIGGGWRVHASHGTSFMAPNFNQLYYPGFSNPLLQPERGRNTEAALSWSAGGHDLRLTRFDNRIRGYISNTTLPQNVPRSRIDGWTLAYEGRLGSATRMRASLDALDPRNEATGRLLPRRAREQATLAVDHQAGAWRFGGSLLHAGARFDDIANTVPLASYTTIDLHAEHRLPGDWRLQFKLANLTDRVYETAYGYNQPGRAAHVTLRWQPR
jgi:vitamin B12 transporter